MYKQGKFPICEKLSLAKGIFAFDIYCPEVAELACPGQFAQVSAEGFFLRRPISICDIDKEKGTIKLVFEIRGKGTERIAELNKGSCIDIIAPLGSGFKVLAGKKAVCVGGGIGVPPMVGIAKQYGSNCTAISGFRDKAAVILQEDFKKCNVSTILCTDDGTAGRRGFVTDALEELISQEKPDIIYACGPMIMLKKTAFIAESNGIECQVSLEERMACGVGACLGCACKVRDENGETVHKHVCKNGPVFDSKEVVFE